MITEHYPQGTIKVLLNSDLVKVQTAVVLKERMHKKKVIEPLFFDASSFQLLTMVCTRLIPQAGGHGVVDLAGLLDHRLADGAGKGWRYDLLPPEDVTFKNGLKGIDETAELLYKKNFTALEAGQQDETLTAIQAGSAPGNTWQQIAPALFFTELLASLVELYYSHPIAKEQIGEVAFADSKGWQKIGLDEHETFEPLPVNNMDNGK